MSEKKLPNLSFVTTIILTVENDKLIHEVGADSDIIGLLAKMEKEGKIVRFQISSTQVING